MPDGTCSTCNSYNNSSFYCKLRGQSQAEWDSCIDHKTYDEVVKEQNAKRLAMIKVGSYDFHEQARETLFDVLAHAQVIGSLTNITASYILAKFDNDPKVVTKLDGVYLTDKTMDQFTINYTEKRLTE